VTALDDTRIDASSMTSVPRPPYVLAIFLIISGAIGWVASFALTVEKFHILADPNAALGCDFSLLVQCGKNLTSWQGAVFFDIPNPVWGVSGFVAPIAVGVSLLAGARFARWFWITFNVGLAGALAFVIFLISQSVYVLGTLCPWCIVVWSVTIPLFWTMTITNLATGRFGPGAVRIGRPLTTWIVPLTLLSYVTVALLAQLRLDVLGHLF